MAAWVAYGPWGDHAWTWASSVVDWPGWPPRAALHAAGHDGDGVRSRSPHIGGRMGTTVTMEGSSRGRRLPRAAHRLPRVASRWVDLDALDAVAHGPEHRGYPAKPRKAQNPAGRCLAAPQHPASPPCAALDPSTPCACCGGVSAPVVVTSKLRLTVLLTKHRRRVGQPGFQRRPCVSASSSRSLPASPSTRSATEREAFATFTWGAMAKGNDGDAQGRHRRGSPPTCVGRLPPNVPSYGRRGRGRRRHRRDDRWNAVHDAHDKVVLAVPAARGRTFAGHHDRSKTSGARPRWSTPPMRPRSDACGTLAAERGIQS